MNKRTGLMRIERACEKGKLLRLAEKYVLTCNICEEETNEKDRRGEARKNEKQKKRGGRFPNIAGFCRFLGIGSGEYATLSKSYPEEFEKIVCLFEDEALNSEISPTLLGTYLKRRLGYDDAQTPRSDVDVGALKLIFEHDIISDGE